MSTTYVPTPATNPVATIFGREPALWGGLVNAGVYLLGSTVLNLSTKQESLVIAVTAAVIGIIVALSTHDGVSAAILGLIKAIVALSLGFGLKMSPDTQALVLSLAATFAAMFVRTQATAKVGPATLSAPAPPAPAPSAPAQPAPAST